MAESRRNSCSRAGGPSGSWSIFPTGASNPSARRAQGLRKAGWRLKRVRFETYAKAGRTPGHRPLELPNRKRKTRPPQAQREARRKLPRSLCRARREPPPTRLQARSSTRGGFSGAHIEARHVDRFDAEKRAEI